MQRVAILPPPLVSLRKLEMIKTAFGKDRPEIGAFFLPNFSATHDPVQALISRYHGLSHGSPLRSTPRANGRLMGRFPRLEAREMDQEPTLPMIGTLTSVSMKKDGLEGHPGPPRHLESPDHPTARSWCRVDPSDAGVLVSQALRLARLASGLRTWSGAQVSSI